MPSTEIISLLGREVLDSRGNPTVEAEVRLACGVTCTAIAPSGASTGAYEAHELRDGDIARYQGKGVKKACANITTAIAAALCGMDAGDQAALDHALCTLDATANKSSLGANATLAVSFACAKAAAAAHGVALFRHLGGIQADTLPMPMMNILNGGLHAANGLDIQEFMIVPSGAESFPEALRMGAEVYHALGSLLKKKGLSSAVGDEGGFAPAIAEETQAIELILEAVTRAGYAAGEDVHLALDAAAGSWANGEKYLMPKSRRTFTSEALCAHYERLFREYPILSIEDPFTEEDAGAWQMLCSALSPQCMIVGDDLFVTHPARISKGAQLHCANAALLKPNQIGTISETIRAHHTANGYGMKTILSHRSGDTEDTAIADLAVALGCGFIKTGAPCRSERVAKYNRLLRIGDAIGRAAFGTGAQKPA